LRRGAPRTARPPAPEDALTAGAVGRGGRQRAGGGHGSGPRRRGGGGGVTGRDPSDTSRGPPSPDAGPSGVHGPVRLPPREPRRVTAARAGPPGTAASDRRCWAPPPARP